MTSSWIAVGMCNKTIMKTNKFIVVTNKTGHGCYMISSNAGTWSHID